MRSPGPARLRSIRNVVCPTDGRPGVVNVRVERFRLTKLLTAAAALATAEANTTMADLQAALVGLGRMRCRRCTAAARLVLLQ
jgi:hypothetical protein